MARVQTRGHAAASNLQTSTEDRMSHVLALLTLFALNYGGWAVITVENLPDQVVTGQPVTLDFTVRQHGHTLLSNLDARVVAEGRGDRVNAAARRRLDDHHLLRIREQQRHPAAVDGGGSRAGGSGARPGRAGPAALRG